jgi:hypothetical protein
LLRGNLESPGIEKFDRANVFSVFLASAAFGHFWDLTMHSRMNMMR